MNKDNQQEGWLIETTRNGFTRWLGISDPKCGVVSEYLFFFTPNSVDALRFSRKIDAEAFIKFVGIPIENNLKVTSHSWTMELVREEGTENA